MMSAQPSDLDLTLLGYLLRSDPLDAGLIRYDLGIEIHDFPKAIRRLEKLGCKIEQAGPNAYRLVKSNLSIWEEYLHYSLRNSSLHVDRIRVYRETASTQDLAKSMAPEQAIILADQQTAGRGRLGKAWHSESGTCALMSIAKRVTGQPSNHDRVSMLTGVAVAQALEKLCPQSTVKLKWPNDLIVNGKKLAGILIEAANKIHIIGIGVNVHHPTDYEPSIRDTAISMSEIGSRVDRLLVIEEILHQLGHILRQGSLAISLDEWRARAALGQTQTFEQAGQRVTGEVVDLDPDHGLIVRRDTGEIVTLPAATTSVVK